jgi:CheY-like chemotaxis protein
LWLGLALVQRLVRLHGGDVCVRSEGKGCGSEFEVRLPLRASPASSVSEQHDEDGEKEWHGTPTSSEPASEIRVLVIDDLPDVRAMLELLLSQWGYRVETRTNGEEGIACALAEPPHIAIVDIGLPDISGYEVARRLRAEDSKLASTLLIATTGFGSTEDRAKALAAGFDDHLVKPVNASLLLATLRATQLTVREPALATPS